MLSHDIQVRVRYAETDQMGFVYYGRYAEYFEMGRVELIRSLGISYREIEERGYFMPVSELVIKYRRAAQYDNLLTIRTRVPDMPQAAFVTECEIFNESGELLVYGTVKLAFVDRSRNMPVRTPVFILEALAAKWPVADV